MRLLHAWMGIVLFASCCIPFSAGAEEYTLNDLYQLALKNSERIQIAREDVLFSYQEKERADSALLPRLTAFGTYARFTEDKYNDFEVLLQPKWGMQYGARADESLSLSLRELTARSIAEKGIQKSKYDLAGLREAYLLQVARAYYLVFVAKRGVEIAESNLARVTKYRNAAVSRLKVDEVTMIVILRAESELSGAKSELVSAQNRLTLAKAELARLVGINGDFTVKEEEQHEGQAGTLPELKELAYSHRPELKSLEYQMEMARQQITYARGAYWPNLCISGVYQRNDQDPDSSLINEESIYGQVTINFPFYEGGLRKSEVQQARIRERQAVLQYEDLKKTVGMEVEVAYLDLKTQKETLKFLQDQMAFAKDNYRGVMRQFELGLSNSIDIIDANDLLVSSERQLSRANFSYQISILALEQATGTFSNAIHKKENKQE